MTFTISERKAGALWCLSIADALAMPVHWYYNPQDITSQFGVIRNYRAPRETHPSSIMSISNTGGQGRGGQEENIVGDVILHGKKGFWGKNGVHYHQGMKAGDNTLNALCSRVLLRGMVERKGYTDQDFLEGYISFMTTPNTHNDTYAESFHREFFKNYAAGVKPEKCAGEEGPNTASIGGFVMMSVVAIFYHTNRSLGIKLALQQMALTHKSEALNKAATSYLNLVFDIIYQIPTPAKFQELVYSRAANDLGIDLKKIVESGISDRTVIGSMFSSACYISDSYPALLYLAAKYSHSLAEALIANVNVGGENCHRGSALGILMGLLHGVKAIPKRWMKGLRERKQIKKEIQAFIQASKRD